jgi:5'-phosphate synthase pdxT subunit
MDQGLDNIGVLDLQGGVQEHLEHFRRVGVRASPVKEARHLDGLAGLVIPGGESTCLRRLIDNFGLTGPIRGAHGTGMKLWGTCAGAILLATEIVGETPFLSLIDITVERNAFGSQLNSFHTVVDVPAVLDEAVPLTFIRAPKITRAGRDVCVLLTIDDYIAAAESASVLATVFHPELTPSTAFHRYFACKCGFETPGQGGVDPAEWSANAWMHFNRIGTPFREDKPCR